MLDQIIIERDLKADLFKEDLEDLKGVKNVRLVGFSPRAFRINLDPEKMKSLHVGMDEITNAIQARNKNTPGGAIKSEKSQFLLRVEGKIKNNEELKNLVIRSNFSGQTIKLKDVAEVIDGADEKKVLAKHNGIEATILIVTKKAGADTVELVKINQKVENFKSRNKSLSLYIYSNEGEKVLTRSTF